MLTKRRDISNFPFLTFSKSKWLKWPPHKIKKKTKESEKIKCPIRNYVVLQKARKRKFLLNAKAMNISLWRENGEKKIMPEKEEPNKEVIRRNNFRVHYHEEMNHDF